MNLIRGSFGRGPHHRWRMSRTSLAFRRVYTRLLRQPRALIQGTPSDRTNQQRHPEKRWGVLAPRQNFCLVNLESTLNQAWWTESGALQNFNKRPALRSIFFFISKEKKEKKMTNKEQGYKARLLEVAFETQWSQSVILNNAWCARSNFDFLKFQTRRLEVELSCFLEKSY